MDGKWLVYVFERFEMVLISNYIGAPSKRFADMIMAASEENSLGMDSPRVIDLEFDDFGDDPQRPRPDRRLRLGLQRNRLRRQQPQGLFDGSLQLRIATVDYRLGIVPHLDVWGNPSRFDRPFAVHVEEATTRSHEPTTVNQGGVSHVPTRPPQVLVPTSGPTPLKRNR